MQIQRLGDFSSKSIQANRTQSPNINFMPKVNQNLGRDTISFTAVLPRICPKTEKMFQTAIRKLSYYPKLRASIGNEEIIFKINSFSPDSYIIKAIKTRGEEKIAKVIEYNDNGKFIDIIRDDTNVKKVVDCSLTESDFNKYNMHIQNFLNAII